MRYGLRLWLALMLLPVAAFCGFGFLATYEPPGYPVLRLAYGILGVSCLVGAGRLVVPRRPIIG